MEIVKFKGEPKTYELPDDIFFTKEAVLDLGYRGYLIVYYSEVFTTPAYFRCQVPYYDLANAAMYAKNCYRAWIKHVEECLSTGALKINKELWLKNIGLKQPHSETTA
jgi:hypothetical protein